MLDYLVVTYFQLDQQKNMCVYMCVSTHTHRKSKWGEMLQLLNVGAEYAGVHCIIL